MADFLGGKDSIVLRVTHTSGRTDAFEVEAEFTVAFAPEDHGLTWRVSAYVIEIDGEPDELRLPADRALGDLPEVVAEQPADPRRVAASASPSRDDVASPALTFLIPTTSTRGHTTDDSSSGAVRNRGGRTWQNATRNDKHTVSFASFHALARYLRRQRSTG